MNFSHNHGEANDATWQLLFRNNDGSSKLDESTFGHVRSHLLAENLQQVELARTTSKQCQMETVNLVLSDKLYFCLDD